MESLVAGGFARGDQPDVVTHEDRDDGIGGMHNYRHYYDTAYMDRSGRGWLSFDYHAVIDDDAGTVAYRYFHQHWPYAGRVHTTRLQRHSDWQKIQESVHSWDDDSWSQSADSDEAGH